MQLVTTSLRNNADIGKVKYNLTKHHTMKTSTLIKHHAMKMYWRSGDTNPRILNLGTRWRYVVSFTPRPLYPHTHWIEGLSGPQSCSGGGGEEKNLIILLAGN
jgi:hypothetical protein